MMNFEECRNRIQNAINNINWQEMEMDKPEVSDELVYGIFGDDLDIENSDDELMEMFLMEM